MAVDVKVPEAGESVQEGMIETWHKKTGDAVSKDELLFELETDKATLEVVSEAAGVITVLANEGDVVKVGDVVATIDESASAAPSEGTSASPASEAPPPAQAEPQPAPASGASGKDPGPAVRRIIEEQNPNLSNVAPTGRDGRVTKADIMSQSGAAAAAPPKSEPAPAAAPAAPRSVGTRDETRKPMSMLRRRIAERLLQSQQESAILTTFNEVDMTNLLALRSTYKDSFFERHGIKLGFMGFFLKASVEALKDFPAVNAYIEGTDLVYHDYCDIGVAVSTPKGLMVPIIRNVEAMAIRDVESEIGRFAVKARENKISLEDLDGGTFTVSNGGVFGSLLSTPIINPPQSAILGMHKTQQRPMVMPNGSIEARPMMYLALSYDHRIIDGREAVGFLVRIKECIEDPARMLLEV